MNDRISLVQISVKSVFKILSLKIFYESGDKIDSLHVVKDIAPILLHIILPLRATLGNSLFLVAGLSKNRVGRQKKIFQKKNFEFFSRILSFLCILRNLTQILPPQVNIMS